jgi:hypothetical protein
MSVFGEPVNFMPEGGEPVFVVDEPFQGGDVVSGIGAPGAPMVTAMPEYSFGMRRVYVAPGTTPPDPVEMMRTQAIAHAQGYATAPTQSGIATKRATEPSSIATAEVLLLLLL